MQRTVSILFIRLFVKLAVLASTTLSRQSFQEVPISAKVGIIRVIIKFVRKYSIPNPVFLCAWALCPAFFEEISSLPHHEEGYAKRHQYDAILDALQRVFTVLALRSPIEKGGAAGGLQAYSDPANQRSLPDAALVAKKAVDEFRKEYIRKELRWNCDEQCHLENLETVDPVVFWAVDAPSSSILRHFAIVILSIIPATSTVERGHKDNRNTLTASRNSIGKEKLDTILRSGAIMSSRRYAQKSGQTYKRDQNGNNVSEQLTPAALLKKLTSSVTSMEELLREDEIPNLWDECLGMN